MYITEILPYLPKILKAENTGSSFFLALNQYCIFIRYPWKNRPISLEKLAAGNVVFHKRLVNKLGGYSIIHPLTICEFLAKRLI